VGHWRGDRAGLSNKGKFIDIVTLKYHSFNNLKNTHGRNKVIPK